MPRYNGKALLSVIIVTIFFFGKTYIIMKFLIYEQCRQL